MKLVSPTPESPMSLQECSECTTICDSYDTSEPFFCSKCIVSLKRSIKAKHRYETLLRKLDSLMQKDCSEDDLDQIRHQMEDPWSQMTREDQEQMRELSEVLYAEWSNQ